MDGYEGQPVVFLHTVSSEIDAKGGLWELWRDFFAWQGHCPGAVAVSVEAEVVSVGGTVLVKFLDLGMDGKRAGWLEWVARGAMQTLWHDLCPSEGFSDTIALGNVRCIRSQGIRWLHNRRFI